MSEHKTKHINTTRTDTTYYTTRPKLVSYLVERGFKATRVPNVYNPKMLAWTFTRTEELLETVKKYTVEEIINNG